MTHPNRYIPTPEQLQAASEDRLKLIVMPIALCEHEYIGDRASGEPYVWKVWNGRIPVRRLNCPYPPGSQLWFGEECLIWEGGAAGASHVVFNDNPHWTNILRDRDELASRGKPDGVVGNWKSYTPDSMPRWASRLHYTVDSVEVKRSKEAIGQDMVDAGLLIPDESLGSLLAGAT